MEGGSVGTGRTSGMSLLNGRAVSLLLTLHFRVFFSTFSGCLCLGPVPSADCVVSSCYLSRVRCSLGFFFVVSGRPRLGLFGHTSAPASVWEVLLSFS